MLCMHTSIRYITQHCAVPTEYYALAASQGPDTPGQEPYVPSVDARSCLCRKPGSMWGVTLVPKRRCCVEETPRVPHVRACDMWMRCARCGKRCGPRQPLVSKHFGRRAPFTRLHGGVEWAHWEVWTASDQRCPPPGGVAASLQVGHNTAMRGDAPRAPFRCPSVPSPATGMY